MPLFSLTKKHHYNIFILSNLLFRQHLHFAKMSNSDWGRGRFVSPFSLPSNIPIAYRRDRRAVRWWSWGSPYRNLLLAAAITLIFLIILVVGTYFLFLPCPAMKLLLSGHQDVPHAMAANMHERRFKSWRDRFKKQRGYRNPVKTCIGLFIFFGLVIVFTI
ncbi:hypothetical protein HDV63DRAFT_116456 [Trichoderma sp. SZMC 28014]